MPSSRTPLPTDASPAMPVMAMTMPVAMGYIPLGTVFGFLFVQAGADWWLAILSSIVVYAGAAQYMMIPMLVAGMPISAIAFATLVVNLRHMFYGLSLLGSFPRRPRALRAYLIFALTDETYSLLTTMPRDTSHRQMVWVAMLNQCWWVLGTAAGALIGARAQIAWTGLDFVLATLFAVLTVEQWRSRHSAAPLWVALAAYALAFMLAPDHALVVAIALSIGAAMLLQSRRSPAGEQA